MSKRTIRQSFRRIFSLALPERRTLLWGILFLSLGSASALTLPYLVRVIIDDAVTQGMASVNRAALLMAGVVIIQGVAVALRHYLFTMAGYRVVSRLRQDVYANLIRQEVGFFDGRKTGELMSRLSSDTTVLQNTVSVNISMGLRNFAMAVGGMVLLFYTSPQLGLVMMLGIPPVSLGAVIFGRSIRKLSNQVQDALAKAAEVAEESLSGIRTVKAFTGERREVRLYGQAVDDSLNVIGKRTRRASIFSATVTFIGFGMVGLVLWYGGRLVVAGEMTIGQLTSFLLYTLTVAGSVSAIAGLWTDFMKADGAATRIFELIDRKSGISDEGGLQPARVQGALSFEDVTFAYPTRPDVNALNQLNLEVAPGEIVALVGPSGSGKSTIAALISRFYDPTQGRIRLDGMPLVELNTTWLRERVGIVAQEPVLFSLSIAENIAYGRPDASHEEIVSAAKVANAHDFIQRFPEGYNTEVGERGIRLSGGQKQRLAIARAVLKNPSLLILDEATSALDAENEYLVKEALDRLMKGRTTLVIAHRLSTVRDADRVVVIDQGCVAEMGAHQQLMADGGFYRKLVERQFMHETV